MLVDRTGRLPRRPCGASRERNAWPMGAAGRHAIIKRARHHRRAGTRLCCRPADRGGITRHAPRETRGEAGRLGAANFSDLNFSYHGSAVVPDFAATPIERRRCRRPHCRFGRRTVVRRLGVCAGGASRCAVAGCSPAECCCCPAACYPQRYLSPKNQNENQTKSDGAMDGSVYNFN